MPQPLKTSGKVGTTRQDVCFHWQGRVAARPKNQGGAAAPPCQNNNVVGIFF